MDKVTGAEQEEARSREGATEGKAGTGTNHGERERQQQKATGRRGQAAQAAPKTPGKTESKNGHGQAKI